MTKTIEKPLKTFINSYNSQKHLKKFDQGAHDHDVLVDLVHIPEGGKFKYLRN